MWLDIKTVLPDDNTEVLVKLKCGTITGAGYYSEEGFCPLGVCCKSNEFIFICIDLHYRELGFISPVIKWKGIE